MSRLSNKVRKILGRPKKSKQSESPKPSRKSFVTDLGNYLHYSATMPVTADGGPPPIQPLYTEPQIASAIADLRAMLAHDDTPECKAALETPFAAKLKSFGLSWYQRIDFPRHGISSTSDHTLASNDEGSLNRLVERLTSVEACILRPWPKWCYLKPLMPSLKDKSVLEVGCANGFFSFRFAELGARNVTGIEAVKPQVEMARWAADELGFKNVSFLHSDFLTDLTIPQHDVVFLAEVHNHFLFPFYGLIRLLNLARETLIIEIGADNDSEQGLALDTAWNRETWQLYCHSFRLTDGLLLDFLNLAGVPPTDIVRYRAPDQLSHMVYVVDTRRIAETRLKRQYPDYLKNALELKFTHPST